MQIIGKLLPFSEISSTWLLSQNKLAESLKLFQNLKMMWWNQTEMRMTSAWQAHDKHMTMG